MMKLIKSLFTSDPNKKLSKLLDRKREEALNCQRNGDLRAYARLTKEINDIEDELFGPSVTTPGNHPDVVDYDGMGNQGRFPTARKK